LQNFPNFKGQNAYSCEYRNDTVSRYCSSSSPDRNGRPPPHSHYFCNYHTLWLEETALSSLAIKAIERLSITGGDGEKKLEKSQRTQLCPRLQSTNSQTRKKKKTEPGRGMKRDRTGENFGPLTSSISSCFYHHCLRLERRRLAKTQTRKENWRITEPRESKKNPGDRERGTEKKKGKSRLWFPWFLLKETEETNEQEKNWEKKLEKKPAFPALLSSPERKRKTKKTGEKPEESVTIV